MNQLHYNNIMSQNVLASVIYIIVTKLIALTSYIGKGHALQLQYKQTPAYCMLKCMANCLIIDVML